MGNAEDLLSLIRWNYSLLYNWLIANGISSVEKDKAEDTRWTSYDDEKYLEYQAEIKKMPHPENATLDQMRHVAMLVVCGLFERHFTQKAGAFLLGHLGRHIEDLAGKIDLNNQNERLQEDLFDSANQVYRNDRSYFEAAARIYGEVFIDNERNIGGQVALADTNWEIQKLNANANKTLFRKARLLNLSEVHERENLFQLTYNNQISITSITIK
jgi:hypothetical protein